MKPSNQNVRNLVNHLSQTPEDRIKAIITRLHLILIASTKGGVGKTASALEVKASCHMSGIGTKLCTFDKSNKSLVNAMRDERLVHNLDMPNGDMMLETFGKICEEAKQNGEIVIADVPPGFNDPDHSLIPALAESTILEEFASISVIIPVIPGPDGLAGAFDALATYAKIPMKIDRGLVRAYRPDTNSPPWTAYPTFQTLQEKFPVWECGKWMQSMTDMLQKRGTYANYPAVHLLPDHLIAHGNEMSLPERRALTAAVAHLQRAKNAIYEHILEPIINLTED